MAPIPATATATSASDWRTKPTDRFVLKWIKTRLSARITPHLAQHQQLRPWMITVTAAAIGVLAGLVLALGWAFTAGCLAALAQVLDGVDGQFARLTGTQTRAGAFWDSVLDRYADGALVIGLGIYLIRLPAPLPPGVLVGLGALALIGSNLISYGTARAETLGLDLGRPTLASKGTRTTVVIVAAWLSLLSPLAPLAALLYLVIHPNAVVLMRLNRVQRAADAASAASAEPKNPVLG